MARRCWVTWLTMVAFSLVVQAQSASEVGRPVHPDDPIVDEAQALREAQQERQGELGEARGALTGLGQIGSGGGSEAALKSLSLDDIQLPDQPQEPLTPEQVKVNQELEEALWDLFDKGEDPFNSQPDEPEWPDFTHMPADPLVTGQQIVDRWKLEHSSDDVPPDLIRSLRSAAFGQYTQLCSPYAQWFLNKYNEMGSRFSRLDGYTEAERPHLLAQIRGFESFCLQGTWPVDREILLQYLGILVADGQKILCSATRISRSEIVTARHCLHDRSGNALPWSRLEFRSAIAPNDPVAVAAAPGWERTEVFDASKEQESDVFMLRGDFSEEEFQPLRRSPLKRYTQLYLVSVQSLSVLAEQIRRIEKGQAPNGYLADGTWPQLIRVDSAPTCASIAVESPCIAHACQTQGGVSGAPLFMVDKADGELRLPAVHTRHRRRRPKGKCDLLALGLVPNSGLLIRQEAEDATVTASLGNHTNEREGL